MAGLRLRARALPCLALALLLVPPSLADPPSRFSLELEDQYGEPMVYPAGTLPPPPPTLVVVADRRGAEQRAAWGESLRRRYAAALDAEPPRLAVLRVAHLGGVPRIFKAPIIDRFFAGEPAVGLDWRGQVAAQIDFVPEVPNLVLLAPDGTIALTLAGAPDEANRRRLYAAVDRLLQASSGG